ncbi:hypothetical protein SLE2022_026200 [Rubroshorea leprosula]
MAQKQLVEFLQAHLSLYHSHSLPLNSNPNPRSSILRWFSSLTLHQRQAYLTVVDFSFVQLIIRMLGKLRRRGHGSFIILADIPSGLPGLPELCYRQSRGLLARVASSNESERRIFESIRLFGSSESEKIEECSCSVSSLDSMTVTEDFVEDVDGFVGMMDKVSNGAFLRGEESELGSDWVELKWLKAKGYYTIEEFVASRLEVALRLAWLNSNNGKKRGVKLKEKLIAAGLAANVYWRKKGCVDWWANLDSTTRRKVLTAALGKAAKALTHEIVNMVNGVSEDEMWLFNAGVMEQPIRYNYTDLSWETAPKLLPDAAFGVAIKSDTVYGKGTSLAGIFHHLLVLQDIMSVILSCQHSEYDIGKVHFSTLGSISTISDGLFRKLRGFLMVISLDCTKRELLGDESLRSSPNKSKEKVGASNRKKKGRSKNLKRQNPAPRSGVYEIKLEKPLKDLGYASAPSDNLDLVKSDKMPCMAHGKEIHREVSSSMEIIEQTHGLSVGKGQAAAGKSKKGKNRNKKSRFSSPDELKNSEKPVLEASSSATFQDEAANFLSVSANLTKGSVSNDNLSCSDLFPNSSTNTCDNQLSSEDIALCVKDHVVSSAKAEGSSHINLGSYSHSKDETKSQSIPYRLEDINHMVDSSTMPLVPMTELDCVSSNEAIYRQHSFSRSQLEAKTTFSNILDRDLENKEEVAVVQEQHAQTFYDTASPSSSQCLSYEWPTLAPVYFPSINSHVPATTDRLHLDVGHNWQNHIRQPFVRTVHQTRNPPIEGACSQILPRPLPMSLDWPPMVRSASRLAPSITYNYDLGFASRRQSAFQQSFPSQNFQFNIKNTNDERKCSGDFIDLSEPELADECDSHWMSEEEFEVHRVSGIDCNQYFGGGVMYWNPSDQTGTGFSRAPSLSSDDSSWAWHEADMSRAVDDMVAFSSSYSTNGLASPPAAPFCSPFDPLGPGHQAIGYVVPGNEVSGKVLHSPSSTTEVVPEEEVSGSMANLSSDVEGKTGDSLPYPILRPIIIPNMSRDRRHEFKRGHEHKSPCVPPSRREQTRIKRPPSPVVLCVPRAPRPPAPSPVSDSRKHRGFPTVRSGSSSPRHWGMRGLCYDGTNLDDAGIRVDGTEVVWPSWRSKNLSVHPMIQPLPGALLQDRLIAISQLARDQEHPDVSFPLQPPELQNCPARKASLSLIHSLLNDEIDSFYKQVAAENMARKPYINWAVKRVTRSLQVLWPRSRTNVYGSNATGLSLPTSDVDLVVRLPPVRNLEPIKEAGILEGRNGIKETCLQHAARYLANQEWVKSDSLKTVENTAIPVIKLVVEVPSDLITSAAHNVQSPQDEQIHANGEHHGNNVHSDVVGVEDSASPRCLTINSDNMKDVKSVHLDISFKSPSHMGFETTELVKELIEQFPATTPLALVLKQFLADRSLDQSYSGGLSSYGLMLLITRFLQHEHHLGRPINQNFGSLLMDFLYFFGNVFDPRQMRVSLRGTGVYVNRERGYSIDPLHIDDPLFPTNNVGRNCFRIHQCIKAFSEAYSLLENELMCLSSNGDSSLNPPRRLLGKIIPSITLP